MADILEIGAGISPSEESTETLDIRTDLDHIDHAGVNIGTDEWPIPQDKYDKVVGYHVLEHVPPTQVGHVLRETYRVLKPTGHFHLELPHAGTYAAYTDLTHHGTGGSTPGVSEYFDGGHEDYWPDLDWEVTAYAEFEFPTIVRESFRLMTEIYDGRTSTQLLKIPFTNATLIIDARMHD